MTESELKTRAIQKHAEELYKYLKDLVCTVEIISDFNMLRVKPEFLKNIKILLASIDEGEA